MSAIFIKFSVPRNGKTSGANARYITRPSATMENSNHILLHNLENLKGRDYRETRLNLVSYAEARLDEESTKTQRGAGNARTHYRAILSFDRNEGSAAAKQLSEQWLKENFPDCRAAAAIHRDTKNTHVHVWVDARKLDDKKLQLDNKKYRQLDESWARIYSERYGAHYLTEHLAKKERTKIYKREYVKAKLEGKFIEPLKDRPKIDYRTREANNYDQAGAGIYKRNIANETTILSRQKREINRRVNGVERSSREIDERTRNSEQGKSQADESELIRSRSIDTVNRLHVTVTELGKKLESEQQREEEKSHLRIHERERERVRER
jgi:hypothetical protein